MVVEAQKVQGLPGVGQRSRQVGAAAFVAASFLLAGCGMEGGPVPPPSDETPAAAATAAASAPAVNTNAAPDAPFDQALADHGKSLFSSKGCTACHVVEQAGQTVGPNLSGVVSRRDFNWIRGMVTQTDSMLANDPVAQELLAQYGTRMVQMQVTDGDVRAIFEYLRSVPDPL